MQQQAQSENAATAKLVESMKEALELTNAEKRKLFGDLIATQETFGSSRAAPAAAAHDHSK